MQNITYKEQTFTSHDSMEIYYKSWHEKNNSQAIILIHRGHEHSGRMQHIVNELGVKNTSFFAWDARGNGKSPGKRGYAPDFGYYTKDLDMFVTHISLTYNIPMKNITIIAQSVGAVIASTWIHDYAPKIKAAILASPAFNVNLIVPGAKQVLQLWQKIRGNFVVKSYVKGTNLTHDIKRSSSYHTDPLVSLDISSNILLELYENAHRVVSDAGAIICPILLLSSGNDSVVFMKEQKIFFKNLGSSIKQHHILEGFFHDTLGESERKKAFSLIEKFLQDIPGNSEVDLIESDTKGFTYDEFIALGKPLPTFSLKNIQFSLMKFSLKYIGKYLSKGIEIAEKTGHDSGSTLDYVYKNNPQGTTFLGKKIDETYLESIGWKGIRQRKVHLGKAIDGVIKTLIKNNQDVKILDIAAGHGRYILDAVLQHKENIKSILLRDYSDINVAAGKQLIQEKGLSDIATFVNGNAFDKDSIAQVNPKPTVGIVSGLYELFYENSLLQKSLSGLHLAIEDGGYLIYTNQPWHPQVELIARTLSSHKDGKSWVMRRRTQAEMDQLVERAGFEKIDQYVDQWGIFTVSIAKKM